MVKGEIAELREQFDAVMRRLRVSKDLVEKEELLADLRSVIERTTAALDRWQVELIAKLETKRRLQSNHDGNRDGRSH